jgi:hypothetical protein
MSSGQVADVEVEAVGDQCASAAPVPSLQVVVSDIRRVGEDQA